MGLRVCPPLFDRVLTDGENIVTSNAGGNVTIGPFLGDLSMTPALSVWTNAVIPQGAVSVEFTAHPTLSEISFSTSTLQSIFSLGTRGNPGLVPNLTTVTITPVTTPPPLASVILIGCALSQATVDALIAACVAGGVSGGQLTLNDGTSSSPSAAAAVDLATLTTRSWSINTN